MTIYSGYDALTIKPTDYCANCRKPLKFGPMGARYACETFHGGNTGFYLTTAGPPGDGFAEHSVDRLRCTTLPAEFWAGPFYVYGIKKDRARIPIYSYWSQRAVWKLLGIGLS